MEGDVGVDGLRDLQVLIANRLRGVALQVNGLRAEGTKDRHLVNNNKTYFLSLKMNFIIALKAYD